MHLCEFGFTLRVLSEVCGFLRSAESTTSEEVAAARRGARCSLQAGLKQPLPPCKMQQKEWQKHRSNNGHVLKSAIAFLLRMIVSASHACWKSPCAAAHKRRLAAICKCLWHSHMPHESAKGHAPLA